MLTSRPKANLPPTEEEYLQVQDDLQQARALLAAVDEEIGLLLEKRQTLEESIANNQRALTSPIRRLPPELLQCIFCLTLPTENNAVMSSKESPLLVSHVCSQWRESALSAPRLWSSLHIPVVYPFPPNAQVTDAEEHYHNANLRKCAAVVAGRRQLIQLWLSRAGKTDLYISLADASSFPAFYTSRVSHERNPMFDPFDILPLLLPYSTQWAELYLAIEPDIARPLLIVPSEQVPRLRSLKLCDFDYTTLVDLPQTNLLSAPTLRSLCFRSLGSLGSNFLKLKIHWSKLTDLSLGLGRHSEGLAELLTSCVSLVSLTVVCTRTGRRRATTHSNLQHHISLPRLQTLHWGCKNRSCSNPIFNYLVLPSLETLIFRVNPISRGLDVSPTLDPLTRWGQGVKNLDICSKSFNSPESFKLTPEVENLTFGDPLSDRWSYDVQLDDTFWKELTVPTISTNHPTPSSLDAAPLLPKLTSIVCHASAFTDDTPSAIRLFIRSRRQNSDLLASIGIQRLVHLRITGFKDRDPEGWAPYPILERSTKDREEIVEELAAVPGVDIKWPDRRTSNEDVMGGLANPVPILGPIASGISHWAYPESYVVFGDE